MRKLFVSFVTPLLVTACSTASRQPEAPAPQARGNSESVHVLGVPPGHLPRAGLCRVWVPGTPPGRQARARSCAGIRQTAPAGSWILYRPTRDRATVRVQVIDDSRPAIIRVVRVYDFESKRLLREEDPGDDDDHGDDRGRGRERERDRDRGRP